MTQGFRSFPTNNPISFYSLLGNVGGSSGSGTVTSISLSGSSAFTITGSPITTSGVFTISGSGSSSQYIDGTGSLQSFPSLTGYVPTTRTLTINGVTYDLSANRSWSITAGVSSVSASLPLSSSGGSTPNITISQATTSTDGYLSSTDWNTFNNKQNALGYTPVPSTRNITVNGTTQDLSADRTYSIAPSGTTGQILAKNSSTDYDYSWIDNYTELLYDTVKANTAITKGQAVYISGANGTNQLASLADNSTEATSSKTLGLALNNMALNAIDKIVTQGLLSGIDTSAATIGDPVWLGTSGNLIFGLAGKPVAPKHLVYIGIVTRVHATNGEIYVRPQNGFELEELHNVLISGVTNNDILAYESATSLWKNKQIATVLGYTPVTNARTLTINGTTQDLSADRTFTVSAGNTAGINLANYYNFF